VAQARASADSFQIDPGKLGLTSGRGQPLPDAVRGNMEAALGADFSNVRVHVGPQAGRIGATAFTIGTDIYFAPGRFQPDTVQGKQLLGHELAHVIQQRQGRVHNTTGSSVAVVQDRALEAEADRLAMRATTTLLQPRTLQPRTTQPSRDLRGATIQRLLVTISAKANDPADFPGLATILIAKQTGNKAASMNSVVAPTAGFFASLFGAGPTKETLYVCAHGTNTGITGYDTAKSFADALKGKGLDKTTLTKIVLVSCGVGGTKIGSAAPVFGRALAAEMEVEVCAPYDLITLHYEKVQKGSIETITPTHFSIRGTEVAVIDGAGLTSFKPTVSNSGKVDVEGYAPPILAT
jgi:hypothetical protein